MIKEKIYTRGKKEQNEEVRWMEVDGVIWEFSHTEWVDGWVLFWEVPEILYCDRVLPGAQTFVLNFYQTHTVFDHLFISLERRKEKKYEKKKRKEMTVRPDWFILREMKDLESN